MLETQLVLKGICTRSEWAQLKEEIYYDFITDAHFAELKDAEILKERLGILQDIDNYVGKYFSVAYIRKKVLKQTEDEMKEIDKEMEEEAAVEEDEPTDATSNNAPEQNSEPTKPVPVIIHKESIDDSDQKALAKSMTKFSDTLAEDAKNNGNK